MTDLCKIAPYGLYVANDNTGFANFGIDHDTGSYVVESIRRWWLHIGSENFKDANRIMIVLDSGESSGWKSRLWKYQFAMLAEEIHKKQHFYHMPPEPQNGTRLSTGCSATNQELGRKNSA
ncbi:MAG: hypothetical protein IJ523_01015 [Succinivibrionaceae bacterium]|nr:hypothetical protein [Succinivibrionaceae bacterium]